MVGRADPPRLRLLKPIAEFMGTEASSGVLLLISTVIALVWANSPASASYFNLWHTPVGVSWGELRFSMSLHHWINDGLMAVFFFLVGLEIKRELLVGELASVRKAAFPIIAAVGGMVVPALIYVAIAGKEASRGWGIPMATDIAFALGVLALLGSRAPFALKVFLAALAIVDDLGAVLVIALFYTASIQWYALALGGVLTLVLLGLNRAGVRQPMPYGVLGIGLWVCFLQSGVHATIAGVLLALTIPARTRIDSTAFLSESRETLDAFEAASGEASQVLNDDQVAAVNSLERLCERSQMPLERIENHLHPFVTYGIIPLFALSNAGVSLGSGLQAAMASSISYGIALGLLIGKPLGIVGACWLAVRMKIAELPHGVRWRHIVGVGFLGGIGFTMSLFIAELALGKGEALDIGKVGILVGSLLSGAVGYMLLKRRRWPARA